MLPPELYTARDPWAAKTLLAECGFCLLAERLPADLLARLQASKQRIIEETKRRVAVSDGDGYTMMGKPRSGNRGEGRFSIPSLQEYEFFEELVTYESTFSLLEAYWKSDALKLADSGGDFCLPGCEYQNLHSDQRMWSRDLTDRSYRAGEASFLIVNFLVDDFTPHNGPLRLVPGTHRSTAWPPNQHLEPDGFKESYLVAPAGTVLVRDARLWHGGTRNDSDDTRMMLGAGYFAPWFSGGHHGAGKVPRRCVTPAQFKHYRPRLQRLIETHVQWT